MSAGPARERRVRVVHLGPSAAGRGGMGLSIQGLLRSPLAERYEMVAIPTWRGTAGRVARVVIFLRALVSFLGWCLRRGPGIVHVHAGTRGSWYRKGVCVAVAKLMRRPVLLQLRVGPWDIIEFDERIGPVRRAAARQLFARPDRVVSVSSAGADLIRTRYGRAGVPVISNPAPEPRLDPVREDGPPTLLYVGGFHDPAKAGDVFLEALPRILEACPGARVVMAGPGELPGTGRRLVEERPEVTWLGWLDEQAKADAFAATEVFVLPSRSEGMPNAMLEAMANGRAVVAAEVGGVPDIVTDHEDGLLVPAGDAEALAGAVSELLADGALRARLGTAARSRAERLTRDEVWGRLDAVYRELA
ncbi:MAG TPA: glycosyltransferase family 4 protein [Thermoleophilaceae bacterium]|nr:glycosyltransferase family 4 protein [Thermoleophilaceae bacterium]